MVSAFTFNTSAVFLSRTRLGIIIISCSLNSFCISKESTDTTSPTCPKSIPSTTSLFLAAIKSFFEIGIGKFLILYRELKLNISIKI